jgi:oligopeptide transport system ATP-binding protein
VTAGGPADVPGDAPGDDEEAPPASGGDPATREADEQPFALVPRAKEEQPLLLAEGVTKIYAVRRGLFGAPRFVHALEEVSLFLRHREIMAVVGESGAGKSTLGRVLLRLEEPTFGRVHFDGHDVTRLGAKALRALRRRMQIVFQDATGSLNPRMTVREIVEEGIVVHGLAGGRSPIDHVAKQLDRVGLPPVAMARFPHELAAGERQRVAIARALAVRPDLLVLDEPTSALDPSARAVVLNLLARRQHERGLSLVLVSSDLHAVEHLAHRTLVMVLGRVVESGPTFAVLKRSLHPYTRALVEARLTRRAASDEERHRLAVVGQTPSALGVPDGCAFHPRCERARAGKCDVEAPRLVEVEPGTHHKVACFFPEEPPSRRR